jgi:hypothetical protein
MALKVVTGGGHTSEHRDYCPLRRNNYKSYRVSLSVSAKVSCTKAHAQLQHGTAEHLANSLIVVEEPRYESTPLPRPVHQSLSPSCRPQVTNEISSA